ncbi:hypothetical protein ACOMHN_039270 [Nucella lapillus]
MQHRPLIFTAIAAIVNHLCPAPIVSLEQGFVYCPAYPCVCQLDHQRGGLAIDCQRLQLTHLPKFLTYYGEVRILSLNQNGIRRLPANAFRDLHVQSLDLTENVISHVHPLAFRGLKDWLEELRLEMNGVEPMPSDAIQGLKKLKVLQIIGCKTHTLHGSVFEGMDHLLELRLQNCSLQTVAPDSPSRGVLTSLKQLQVLDMRGNLLTTQGALTLVAHLYGLRRLVLARNRLTHLPHYAFQHLRHLRYLDLSENQMTHVDVDAFRRLGNSLTVLNLHHNHLTHDIFLSLKHLRNLQQLTLGRNNVTSIPAGSLFHLHFLERLELDRNDITELGKHTLKGTEHNIQILRLDENPISVLHKDTFQDHMNLQELILDNTRLGGRLHGDMFQGISKTLKKLSISEAGLTSSDLSALSTITTLEDLVISRNIIADIPHGTFSRMHNLKKLNMSLNHIHNLPGASFRGLEDLLESVDLHGNLLSTVSGCVFDGFQNLRKLHLQNNPLVCDCRMAWLHNWLQTMLIEEDRTVLEWRCVGPEAVSGRAFGSLSVAELQCPDTTTTLHPFCSFNSSNAVDDFEEITDYDDPTSPFTSLPPSNTVKEISLHLEIQPLGRGSLLAVWNTAPTTTPVTGFRLTLRRRSDSKQEADVTLAAEVTQYLFTGLAGEMVYETCVTVLGDGSIPVGADCVQTSIRDNRSAPVRDKVIQQTSAPIPVSITALIWSYVSGCFVAFILCIVLAILLQRRRRRRQTKSPSPFNPGYLAWGGHRSCSSLDESSSGCHLDFAFTDRDHAETGKGGDVFGRNLRIVDDLGEKAGERVFLPNLSVDYRFVFGNGKMDFGELEGDDDVVMKGLGDFDSISERIGEGRLANSESTLAKRIELAVESFTEEDSTEDVERMVRRMGRPTFAEEVGLERMQDSGVLRLGTFGEKVDGKRMQDEAGVLRLISFGKEVGLERMKDDPEVILDKVTLDSLVGFEGSLKRMVPEVEAVKKGESVYYSLAESENSGQERWLKNPEPAVPNRDVKNQADPRDTLERLNVVGTEALRKGMHVRNLSGSSGGSSQRRNVGKEAPRLEILCGNGETDVDVSIDDQSDDGIMNPLHQQLPANYVLTTSDLTENVILQI